MDMAASALTIRADALSAAIEDVHPERSDAYEHAA